MDIEVEAGSVKEDHSCCKRTPQEISAESQGRVRSLKSYAVGALAGFLACLCCSVPLIPLMLGLSGALVLKDQLGAYHQFFETGAIVILLAACVFMWNHHKKSGKPIHSFLLHVAVTFAMYGLMNFAMKELLAPVLGGTNVHSGVHAHHLKGQM